jgi:hypothetical protein
MSKFRCEVLTASSAERCLLHRCQYWPIGPHDDNSHQHDNCISHSFSYQLVTNPQSVSRSELLCFLYRLQLLEKRTRIQNVYSRPRSVQYERHSCTAQFLLFTHKYTHTHTYTHAYAHINTHTHIHTYTHAHTYTHTHAHTYIHTHTHTHIHTHTYAHTYIHTYTHTHTHTTPQILNQPILYADIKMEQMALGTFSASSKNVGLD